jgi:uncharacterized phage-associated protein
MDRRIPGPNDTFNSAVHWQMRAEKMREIAEESHDATVRAMLRRVAVSYERLSKDANQLDLLTREGTPQVDETSPSS